MVTYFRGLQFKMSTILLTLLAASALMALANIYLITDFRGVAAQVGVAGLGRTIAYRLLSRTEELGRLADSAPADTKRVRDDIREAAGEMSHRYDALLSGDPAGGVAALATGRGARRVADRQRFWEQELLSRIGQLADSAEPSATARMAGELVPLIRREISETGDTVVLLETLAEQQVDRFTTIQIGFVVLVLMVVLVSFGIVNGIVARIRSLAGVADRIADGDLEMGAEVRGGDEIARLAEAFNKMTTALRGSAAAEREGRRSLEQLLSAITDASVQLGSGSAQILAAAAEQTTGAQQQASAVSETAASVAEVVQTAEQTVAHARSVSDASARSAEIGSTGLQTVEDAVRTLEATKRQMDIIGGDIETLAEYAQSIGQIVNTVTDLAERTNLVALNAGIEAARAGEQGAGFSYVAREIKGLADQSKQSTVQVRQILGEIQDRMGKAVSAMQRGAQAMDETIDKAKRAGESVEALAAAANDAAEAAKLITGAVNQQATAMSQIEQAISEINSVTTENLMATQHTESAARNLTALGKELRGLLDRAKAPA